MASYANSFRTVSEIAFDNDWGGRKYLTTGQYKAWISDSM